MALHGKRLPSRLLSFSRFSSSAGTTLQRARCPTCSVFLPAAQAPSQPLFLALNHRGSPHARLQSRRPLAWLFPSLTARSAQVAGKFSNRQIGSCRFVSGASRKQLSPGLFTDRLIRTSSGRSAPPLQAMAAAEDVITAQFSAVEAHLEDLNSVRERIREVVARLDGTMRTMHSELLTIHGVGSDVVKLALEKCREKIPELQREYQELGNIMEDRPREYYRFNDQWRSQSSTVSFLLCFMHWLETGALLSHEQVEAQLNLDRSKFGIDIEDYLIGVCSLSSELPRFVINRVTIGDYECPRRVACFLNDLFAAFRKLNLRNDLLRRKFDGLKYDLKKVEEVLYDVEIRGLGNKDTAMS